MCKLKMLMIGIALSISSVSHAGLYAEPFVAYESGSYKGNLLLTNLTMLSTDNDLAGIAAGTKLGWQFKSFGFGLDAEATSLKLKDKTSGEKADFTTTDFGLYLRWDISRFQIYTSFMTSTAKDENFKNGGLVEDVKGSGMKFGIGYRIFKHGSLNLEFVGIKYDKTDEPAIVALSGKRDSTRVSVSFPFGNFGK